MLSVLNGGGFLGTLFDQASMVGKSGAKLTFMKRPAMTNLGPLRLSAITGAAVVPLFCRRMDFKYFIEIYPTILPPSSSKDRRWLISTDQNLNDILADFIRAHPDQWMWSHRRWKMTETYDDKPIEIPG